MIGKIDINVNYSAKMYKKTTKKDIINRKLGVDKSKSVVLRFDLHKENNDIFHRLFHKS